MEPGKPAPQADSRPSILSTSALHGPDSTTGDAESLYQLAVEGQVADVQRQLFDVCEWATTLRDEVDYLRREIAQIEDSRSWRLTEPFRRAARTWRSPSSILTWPTVVRLRRVLRALPLPRRPIAYLKRFVLHRVFGIAPRVSARGEIASAGGRLAANLQNDSRTLPPLAEVQSPDAFMWGIVDWHSRTQRTQHLASGLAGAHRVFYISPQFLARTRPGFEVEPLDENGRLFVIRLHVQPAPLISGGASSEAVRAEILAGLGRVLEWTGGFRTVNLVQHPFWLPFAEVMPSNVLIYDYLDHHPGVAGHTPDLIALERRLLHRADLIVVTSSWLQRVAGQVSPRVALVRDAVDHEHFSRAPADIHVDPKGRRIVGYQGVIAEWFDLDLVRAVARAFPDVQVLLVGQDTVSAGRQLAAVDNITFTGEVPYEALPGYLHAFDVCIVPFRLQPLTVATNPIKVYEYLCAGKPVVAVDLPEMRQFGDLVRRAGSIESFVSAVGEGLAEPAESSLVEARRRFVKEQTWTARVDLLRQQIDAIPGPLISLIVVTHNNLKLTKECLASLDAMTSYPNYEVIVVDNASGDGTQAFLEAWRNGRIDRRLILNLENRGFAAANNQGLGVAAGEYLVLLNNDTVMTPGWLGTLIGHLRRDPRIGMIGPVTNNIDNEARLDIGYADFASMQAAARIWTSAHLGRTRELPSLAFFCAAMSREVYREVGPLDEAFSIGMFEDDDYCRRVEQTGRRILCALDVFIHHQSAASFDAMDQARRWELFERNRQIYEAKWGPWRPHRFHSRSSAVKAAARGGGPQGRLGGSPQARQSS